jgi:hypothetical protein
MGEQLFPYIEPFYSIEMRNNMTNRYTTIAVVISVIVVAALLANTRTTFGQQEGTPPTDSIIMSINLKRDTSVTVISEKCTGRCYYQVSTWYMNASKGSKLCLSGYCQYSIENTQLRSTLGGYEFEGLLKVSVVGNDTTNSKFYPIHAEFDKTASQEKHGQTTEILQGSIKFGKDTSSPDFEYKVQNGTLLVDPNPHVLTLKGVRG